MSDAILFLHDVNGGELIKVPGTIASDGSIAFGLAERVPAENRALLILLSFNGGASVNVPVTIQNDGRVILGSASDTSRNRAYMPVTTNGAPASLEVDIASSGALTLPAATFENPVVAPTYDGSEIGAVDDSTVSVRFSIPVQATNFASGVTIKVNTVGVAISAAVLQSGGSIVHYTIPAVSSDDVVTWEYSKAGGNIGSAVDNTLLENVTAKTVTNNLAAMYGSSEVGAVLATTVVTTFNVNVVAAGSDYKTGVVITVNGVPAVIATGTRQTNHKKVYYVIPAVDANDVVLWSYVQATGAIVSESGATPLEDVTDAAVTNTVAPAPPQFSAAEIGVVGATTVATTFTQKVTAAGNDYKTGVIIKVNTVPAVIASSTRQADHKVVYYVIPAVDADDVVTIEYSTTTGIIKQEDDGSTMASFAAQAVTNTVAGVAPTFVSGEVGAVGATTVVVVFSVAVKAAGNDYTTGVTIKKGGAGQAISAGVRQALHTTVYYTIPAIVNGDVVTIEYDDATGLIQNEADSEPLATFGAQAVTNNVA